MEALANRLKEPSSWAGIAALFGIFGIPVAPEIMQPVIQVGTGAAALAAIFLREKK